MAQNVIFPLSEATGQQILAALGRIAVALETMVDEPEADTATYVNGDLVVDGASVDSDGVLVTTATVDANGILTY